MKKENCVKSPSDPALQMQKCVTFPSPFVTPCPAEFAKSTQTFFRKSMNRMNQRKLLEGIETLRKKSQGKVVLNQYNQMDSWKGVLSSLFNNDDQPSDVR